MADQTQDVEILTTANHVGYSFVEQYYKVLNEMPQELHRFYAKASLVSRPGSDDVTMTTVDIKHATMDCQSIYLSMVDSQFSIDNGVVILVTGNMVGSDNVTKRFVQTFFLAKPEASPYYHVMNDIFKFVSNDSTNSSTIIAEEPIPTQTTHVEADRVDEADHVTKNRDVASESGGAPDEADSSSSNSNEEAPKKSFASIVSDLSKNQAPFKAPQPKHVDNKPRAQVASRPSSTKSNTSPPTIVENNNKKPNSAREVKASHAIYVALLPMSATVEELGKLFARFGAIKRHGIQVRSNQMHGTCFAFVDFESASAMQSAIEASPIAFASRSLSVQEKRPNNNDKFRGRGYMRKDGAELAANPI